MNLKIRVVSYVLVFGLTTAALFVLSKEKSIYSPIIWLLFGFGYQWYSFMMTYLALSTELLKSERIVAELNLEIHPNRSQIMMTSIFVNLSKITVMKPDLKKFVIEFKTRFRLAIIGFLLGIGQIAILLAIDQH